MSAVALLWEALAARLLDRPFTKPLIDFGDAIHDRYYLPSALWTDFQEVRAELAASGIDLPETIFREIWGWRFPELFHFESDGASLTVRQANDGWPLLCETPLEGGSTSRFVDTSIERLEFVANRKFHQTCELAVQGRSIVLTDLRDEGFGAGLRYRRSALYPCLHPGIPVQIPLYLTIHSKGRRKAFRMDGDRRAFAPCPIREAPAPGAPCQKLHETLLTYDLRLV
jgi:uncharacterized protein (DUF2126 family)